MKPIIKQNIFKLAHPLPSKTEEEQLEKLVGNDTTFIERIVSTGQVSPPNFWYEQDKDEWVVLLQGSAKLIFDTEEGQLLQLQAGDAVFIAAKRKHKVVFTSNEPPCIWLAVHGQLS